MLTDKRLQNLKGKKSPYRVSDDRGDGFGVQVTPAGRKNFYLAYVLNDKRRFMNLGNYPDTSLADARKKAGEARALVSDGTDPQTARDAQNQEREKQERQNRMRGSLRELMTHYCEILKAGGRTEKYINEVERVFEREVFPTLPESTKAADVTQYDISRVLSKAVKRGKARQADMVRSILHTAFKVGIQYDIDPKNIDKETLFGVMVNPVMNMPKQQKTTAARNRHLSFEEIRRVWGDLAACGMTKEVELLIKLAIAIGGQRITELREAEWKEIDLQGGLWEVPRERIKSRPQDNDLIPLGNVALELLKQLHKMTGDYVYLFPVQNTERDRPMPEASQARAVVRMLEWQEKNRPPAMEKWIPGNIRSTVKSRMGEIGVPKDIRDRLQKHALQDISSKHYDRYSYLDEKRRAIAAWDIALRAAIEGKEIPHAQCRAALEWRDNVVKLQEA